MIKEEAKCEELEWFTVEDRKHAFFTRDLQTENRPTQISYTLVVFYNGEWEVWGCSFETQVMHKILLVAGHIANALPVLEIIPSIQELKQISLAQTACVEAVNLHSKQMAKAFNRSQKAPSWAVEEAERINTLTSKYKIPSVESMIPALMEAASKKGQLFSREDAYIQAHVMWTDLIYKASQITTEPFAEEQTTL